MSENRSGSNMKIIDNLLYTSNYEAPVIDVHQGPFQTVVLTRNCGLASTPHDPGPHHSRNSSKGGRAVDG